MSDTDHPPLSRAPIGIKKYVEIQRKAGSCIPQFKASVKRASKFGFFFGVPFGIYVGYKYHPRAFKPFFGTSVGAAFSFFITFTGIGIVIASYNCLRVYK